MTALTHAVVDGGMASRLAVFFLNWPRLDPVVAGCVAAACPPRPNPLPYNDLRQFCFFEK
jgi:hypothetical protein